MRKSGWWALAVAGTLVTAVASTEAQATNLLNNGDFEGGTYTSNGNAGVPNDWTSNAAFDSEPSFNNVNAAFHQSGANSLSIGNFDYEPLASLSQSFTDVAGASYSVTFWAFDGGANGDGSAFLQVSAGANSVTLNDAHPFPFEKFSFGFTGTGSDTLMISATTDPSEWFVDNVSVSSGVPELSTWAMLVLGFVGLGFGSYRQTKARSVSFAAT